MVVTYESNSLTTAAVPIFAGKYSSKNTEAQIRSVEEIPTTAKRQ